MRKRKLSGLYSEIQPVKLTNPTGRTETERYNKN